MVRIVPALAAVLSCALGVMPALAASAATAPAKTVNTVQMPSRIADMGVPTLQIPASSVGLDLCLGETSGAYGSAMLAVTFSGPVRDRDCTDLRLSKWAADLRHPALAYQIGCESKPWREADAVTEHLCIARPRPWWRFW